MELSQHVGAIAAPCAHGPELRAHMAEPVFCQPGRQSMPGAHCPPAAPALCQPRGWPYMAPYCPPMLPLQCLRPSVEEGPIGEAWAEPVLPAHEPVVAATGAEPLASPVTRSPRSDQSNWMEPASMQATGVAAVSAGSRPMHSHRPTSSSSTPSSTDTEDAAPQSTTPVANLQI